MKKDSTARTAQLRGAIAPASLRLFQVYEPKTMEGRESRLSPPVTFHLRRALRKKGRHWGKPPGVVAVWALREGLAWIDDQWQTTIIRDLVGRLDDAESDRAGRPSRRGRLRSQVKTSEQIGEGRLRSHEQPMTHHEQRERDHGK